jgi:iron uptake system EfeUOB component EfeO/EfeM
MLGMAMLAGTLVLAGCQAEQRPGGTVSVSGTDNSATQASSSPSASSADTPAQQLSDATSEVEKVIAAAQSGDMTTARKECDEFHDKWASLEDGVKTKSQEAYTAIEEAIDGVKAELMTASQPAKEPTVNALEKLRQVIDGQKSKLAS